jgi:hypothetical protein
MAVHHKIRSQSPPKRHDAASYRPKHRAPFEAVLLTSMTPGAASRQICPYTSYQRKGSGTITSPGKASTASAATARALARVTPVQTTTSSCWR